MKVPLLVVILLVGAAFGGGWYTSKAVQKPQTVTAQTQVPPATTKSTTDSTEPVDIYSGTGMSPNKLYDTLNSLTGVDFDKRYINYVILMQSDLTGINRLAKEKGVAPALQAKAAELWTLDDQRLSDLFALQKQLGYSHH